MTLIFNASMHQPIADRNPLHPDIFSKEYGIHV
jgi:hypothetical protein